MPWHVMWYDSDETIVVFEPVFPWTWKEYVEDAPAGGGRAHFVWGISPGDEIPPAGGLGLCAAGVGGLSAQIGQ